MKIPDRDQIGATGTGPTQGAVPGESTDARKAARAAEDKQQDRASLSGLAGRLAEAVSGNSEAQSARLEKLRVEVASGRYHPDPAEISRGIVKETLAGSAGAGGSTPASE